MKEMHETIGDLKAEVEQLQQSSPKATRIPHGTTAGVPSSQIVSSMDKLKALPRQVKYTTGGMVWGQWQLIQCSCFLLDSRDPEQSAWAQPAPEVVHGEWNGGHAFPL